MTRAKLFHGTVADIVGAVRPPGRGSPRSVHNSQGYRSGQRSDEHAFATEKESEAWQYASMATYGPRKPGSLGTNAPPKGRARVYEVAPAHDQELGRYHPDHPGNKRTPYERWHEHVSKTGFPVTGRIDIKPGHQGTFPQVNWEDHVRSDRQRGVNDYNHPTPYEVHEGHVGSQMQRDTHFNVFEGAGHHREGWPNDSGPNLERAREMTRQQVPGQLALHLGAQFQ